MTDNESLDDHPSRSCALVPMGAALDHRDPSDFTRHLATIRPALDAIHRNKLPQPSCVALPPELDRAVLRHLPFRVRTWNCLTAARLFEGHSAVTVDELLRIKNFGKTSLRDLLLVVEDYLQTCIREPAHAQQDTSRAQAAHDAPSPDPRTRPDQQSDTARPTKPPDPLSQILVAVSEFHGYNTLVELFTPEVVRLASIIGVFDSLQKIDIRDMASHHASHSAIVLHDARKLYAELSPNQRTVLDLRFLRSPRRSLVAVGVGLGVTRQRVQQIHARVMDKLASGFGTELQEIVAVLTAQLGPIALARDVDRKIETLFVDDGTPIPLLVRYVIRDTMGYSRRPNGICLNDDANDVVRQIMSDARRLSVAGIIDQARLRDSLPDRDWLRHWPLLLKCCPFYDLFGLLSLRNSDRVRTKAALLSIGVPATREEISELCGLSVARVGSYLSSFSDIVRADKLRWGIAEWIDDEYEGIEAAIAQRIEEGGGVASTNRLIEELPRKFGVLAVSVHAYLQRPMFAVQGNHVTLAEALPRPSKKRTQSLAP